MKTMSLLTSILLFSCLSWADDSATDSKFGDLRKIKAQTFYLTFLLKGEVFVLDSKGSKLIAQLPEERTWKFGGKSKNISSKWSFSANEIKKVMIRQQLELREDSSFVGSIQLLDPSSATPKILKEEKLNFENFAPFTWTVQQNDKYRVVIRLTPQVDTSGEAQAIEKVEIGGDRGSFVVTDNQGYVWGDEVRFGGVFAGLKSHRGGFIISLYPFKGASEMGEVQGKVIDLRMTEQLRVRIQNDSDIVPGEGKTKVYGIYLPNFKMEKPTSNWSFGQMKYEGIPEDFLKAAKQK